MIVLTGASGGIGSVLVRKLTEFDEVIGLYNKTFPQKEVKSNLIYEQLDLIDENKVARFIKKNEDKLSKITVVHCAAIKKDNLSASFKMEDWDNLFGVNLRGNFILTKHLLIKMIRDNWGRIIHFSSKGSEEGAPGTIAYSASKTALFGMSRVLCKEYAKFNITSNVISLGAFDTGLYSTLSQKYKNEIISKIPSNKLGKISDIANAIKFIIDSEYVNGSIITIDGGT